MSSRQQRNKQPRRVRRARRRPAPRRRTGWCCSTATGAASSARSTWSCATGDVLVVCEVKTRSVDGVRPPARGGRPRPRCARLRTAGGALAATSTTCTPARSGSTWSGCCSAERRRGRGRARAGGRLMASPPPTPSRCRARSATSSTCRSTCPHGLVGTALVGRPDASITEARDRCRAAVMNSGFDWPTTRRVTILLSPADLPKRGPHFDLAIAVAVLAAARRGVPAAVAGAAGDDRRAHPRRADPLRPRRAADDDGRRGRAGIDTVFVPEPQAAEAAMVPGMEVFGIRSLAQVVALLTRRPRSPTRRGRADVRRAAARPGAARSGSRTSTWPTCSAWRTPATPSRSRPPAATT